MDEAIQLKKTVMRDPERTKDAILSAAEQVVIERGFQALTLDEVAARASVSKGGLLHHFPSKSELICGLGQQVITLYNQEIERFLREDPKGPGAYTRAFLRANLAHVKIEESCQVCMLIAAETRNLPKLRELFRQDDVMRQKRFETDGLDPILASVIRYAVEGIASTVMWGITLPPNLEELVQYLINLSHGGGKSATRTKPAT
jgi:AcrR family transcriptional regulator